ncbi:uncharacterized protein LOC143601442 [Bidens hawaiensis]|uniref:uncharacterized protein LOC143601442 n=1 Tax=Bidens hawaiensis TaxID=980011 RepID=UPI004049BA73
MADGTRARVMEDTVKGVQEEQRAIQNELDGVVSASHLSSNGAGSSILGRHKPAPVYLARFNGVHPERWVAQASRYFELYSIPDLDRLIISSFYLDEAAADWYDWVQRYHQISTWNAFTEVVKRHFRSNDLEKKRFEKGLGRVSLGSSKPLKPTPKLAYSDAPITVPVPGKPLPSPTTTSKDHKCKATPQLLFFDEDLPDPGGSPAFPSCEGTDSMFAKKLQLEEVQTQSAISYNALSGGCSSTTLRFTGSVHGKSVQVLVGSGERLPCSGLAKKMELVIQGQTIIVDFYVLPLQGWDMVLGVSWLATLGPVVTDYSTSVFEFSYQGNRIKWQGDPTPVAQAIHFNGFRQLVRSDSIGQLFHLTLVPPDHKPPDYPPELQAILIQFTDVFTAPKGLPPIRSQDHHIELLPASKLISVRPYRYPHFQKQEIERLVQEMLHQGIIRPSTSVFTSPVILVRKKDGTWRFYVDYRALNSITVRDRFPIPSIDELFDELHAAHYFSKLDLLVGYHQIRIANGDAMKTAFRTYDGHYEFLVMPFGLTNAPSTFQSLMNDVFRPFLHRFILVFFDDILIYSKTWEDHLHHIRLTLQLLLTHKLVAKLSKCTFGQNQVAYLGHIISSQGVAVDPDKISTIQQWSVLKNVKDDAFSWTPTTLQAFKQLKSLLCSTAILRLPDISKPFTIETDASGNGIGVVLSQDKHPLAYFSKKLCPRMQQASTYHREMYAITQAIAKWRQYLLGHKFTILTDQQSLKRLQDQVIQTLE